jgi:pyrroloquinoline quinone biosynthesis protein B
MTSLLSNRRTLIALLLLSTFLVIAAIWWTAHDDPDAAYIAVLGTAQDGGHPQIGCLKECCAEAAKKNHGHMVSCLALVDPASGRRWVFDATPDFPAQLRLLDELAPAVRDPATRDLGVDGIFLTHAHMGHYTGLMYLGREALGATGIPVYALPRMREFLSRNGPWEQLIGLQNIEILALEPDRVVELGGEITVTPVLVPHRDEYSETAGFLIATRRARALYVPDIDKWESWERQLADVLADVDLAFIDGTFFSAAELPGRNLAEIPHPTVQETMALLKSLPERERRKVHFIHLNHSNPALDTGSAAAKAIRAAGIQVAEQGSIHKLD